MIKKEKNHSLRELKIFFQQLTLKEKFFFFLLFLLIFFIGLVLGASVINKRQSVIKASLKPVIIEKRHSSFEKTAFLKISPSYYFLFQGETFPVSVEITDGEADAVDVVINYDPSYFSVSSLTPGPLFPEVFKSEVKKGKIIFSAAVKPTNPVATGNGEVFSFNLTALSPVSSTAVSFDPEETVVAKEGENVLKGTSGASYSIQ